MPFQNAGPESDRGKRHVGPDGVIREPNNGIRERGFQVCHALQGDNLWRRGIEVRAFQQGIVGARVLKDLHRSAERLDGLHACRHDHWFALRGNVPDERQVVGFA